MTISKVYVRQFTSQNNVIYTVYICFGNFIFVTHSILLLTHSLSLANTLHVKASTMRYVSPSEVEAMKQTENIFNVK